MEIGIKGDTNSPPQGNIPGQDLNNEPKPVSAPLGDVTAVEVPEVNMSSMEGLPDIDTLPMTLGSQRPIQGYTPFEDLPWMREWNVTEDTLSARIMAEDQNQIHLALRIKGLNIVNPLSLPPVPVSTPVDTSEATLAGLLFGGNGPSIGTPGSAKRAAVEQSAATIRSVIINAFNRDIPYTQLGMAQRTLVMACYEQELLKLQAPFQAIDMIRGYAEYQAQMGTPLDDTWLPLYSPNVYTAMVALYNSIGDLLIYDKQAHERLEKFRIYAAHKRNAVPGTCIMQDAMSMENAAFVSTTPITVSGGGVTVTINPIMPNLTLYEWMRVFVTSEASAMAAIQTLLTAAAKIRSQYEVVITALNQLVSKGSLPEVHLREFIPAEPTPLGVLKFASGQPSFSWAFHERFEYAPERYAAEVGSTAGTFLWNLADLPDYATPRAPSACIMRRPVGLCHGSNAWKVAELIDIGLFKAGDMTNWPGYISKCTQAALTTHAPCSILSDAGLFVDAVFGDLYTDGCPAVSTTAINGLREVLHGMSFAPAGSGLQNMLSAPIIVNAAQVAVTAPGIEGYAYTGYQTCLFDGGSSSEKRENVRGLEWLVAQIDEACDLHFSIHGVTNSAGERQIPYVHMSGYALSGFYSFSLAAVDNAVGTYYLKFVPQMEYTRRR